MREKLFDLPRYTALARRAAADGIVLLKNRDGLLPLRAGSPIALFGRAQFHYYKSGTGSGGLVNVRHVTGIREALEGPGGFRTDDALRRTYLDWLRDHPYDTGSGWAQEPWFQQEMPLEERLVEDVRRRCDTAVVVIGRTAGEDQDSCNAPGSFLLTAEEERMLSLVCQYFERSIVLLNVGGIMDMQWVARYDPAAVLYVWQGGQEGGNGVLDVLNGTVCPSGRLADTIAVAPQDYPAAGHYGDEHRNLYAEDIYIGYRYFETFAPEKVLYPFGFGLSYTSFDRRLTGRQESAQGVTLQVGVTNTGGTAGRETVLVYAALPQGRLGKPTRTLCAFGKTGTLAPGQSQTLTLTVPWRTLASYDDSGATGHRWAWVLEAGEYTVYLGGDVRRAEPVFTVTLEERVLEQLSQAAAPVVPFARLRPGPDGQPVYEDVPLAEYDPAARRAEGLAAPCTGDKGLRLWDVAEGRAPMEEFLAQLTDEDLCCMVRGEGMCSPKVTPGTAGAFGGVTDRLQQFGIPAACCADGPSGIRMDCGSIAFSLPNGACLASTFDEELLTELYACTGAELRKNHIETLLGPGINLHRHPLNGRNFEYFSEDPLLTGRLAAAQLKGLHRWGVTGTIKHFACNNQEYRRHCVEAVVSERALRELYLCGFEIAVKEGGARSIMTSYNPLNGFWTASFYDLVTVILREQWGYEGIVMSDWWAKGNDFGADGDVKNVAAMVRAQNDLYMVVTDSAANSHGDDLAESLASGALNRGELLRSAANICRFVMNTAAFRRLRGTETEEDHLLDQCAMEDDGFAGEATDIQVDPEADLDAAAIDTGMGSSLLLRVTAPEQSCTLELGCRAAEGNSPLAQIPLSVFVNQTVVRTITLTGAQTDWRTEQVKLPAQPAHKPFYIKLYFGQSGMELNRLRIFL